MSPRRNVLIFHSGALGDFVLTWPLALALGRLFPQSRIFYVVGGQKGALAERVLRVESVDVEGTGWHQLFSESPALPERAAKMLGNAHCVLGFVAEPGGLWERNVRAAAPEAQVVSLSPVAPADLAGHQTDYLLAQLAPFPALEQALRQILRSVEQRGVTASPVARPDGPVVLHPGSGSRDKCWPVDRFVELAQRITRNGRRVRVVLGEVEAERWTPDEVGALTAAGDVRQPQTLLELFVGNDSGPGHLAGILGLPSVCLFGPTDPARWRPLGPRVTVLRRTPLETLPVSEVYDTVAAPVGAP